MNRTIYKIITPKVRKTLDQSYQHHRWYKLVRKHKWDELVYPFSRQTIYKMNPICRKYFLNTHKIVET